MTIERQFAPPRGAPPRSRRQEDEAGPFEPVPGPGEAAPPVPPAMPRRPAPADDLPPRRPETPPGPEPATPLFHPEGDDLDLRAFVRLLRRRLAFILVASGLILAALVPPILSMERTYTAQLRLRIERPESVALASPTSTALIPLDLATEMERLRAQSTALRVIEDLGLERIEEFNPPSREPGLVGSLMDRARAFIEGSTQDAITGEEGIEWNPVLAKFYEALGVMGIGSSDVVVISFRSQDPQLAAEVPNHVVEVYLEQRREQAGEQATRAKRWLADRIEAQRDRVRALSVAATEFRVANNLNFDGLENEAAAQFLALSTRLADIERSRRELTAALADLERGNATSATLDDFAPPLLTELRRDLDVQQREIATLRQTYGENHARVTSALAASTETEAAIRTEEARLAEALRLRIASADQEAQTVGTALADARAAELQRSAKEVDYEGMMQDLDRERAKLSAFEDQLRTLEGDAVLPVAEAEILSPATPPRWPDGRGHKFYLALAIMAALGMATTAACLYEIFDRSVRSQHQFRGMPGVVPAGLIPRIPRRDRRRLPAHLLRQPETELADAFRWLMLSLRRRSDGAMPRSILVTSALPWEGKTTVAVGLATALVAAGHRVLLVDADLRRGSAHQHLGLGPGPGLRDLLCGQADLASVITHDPASGVEFIGRGTRGSWGFPDLGRVAELLDHGMASDLIVIFDSAPVLASAETAELADLTDASLLVARWGRTPLRVAQLAVERLLGHRHGQVAVTVNMVVPRRHARYSFPDSDLFTRRLRGYRLGGP